MQAARLLSQPYRAGATLCDPPHSTSLGAHNLGLQS